MTALADHNSLALDTDRLRLIACTAPIAKALTLGKRRAETRLGMRLAPDYPSINIRNYLPFYASHLEGDPSELGWGIWLIVQADERAVIGDVGFKGRPQRGGSVDIGYGIAPAYRGQGYAYEAAYALRNWAFQQPEVERITADCLVDNHASARILQKLGMQRTGHAPTGLLLWEMRREHLER